MISMIHIIGIFSSLGLEMLVSWICIVNSFWRQNSAAVFSMLGRAGSLKLFGTWITTEGLMQRSSEYME